ncbi:MAG: hypothetical protein GY754_45900 [bacterium]|nr:hypothetical protein [bacterium]
MLFSKKKYTYDIVLTGIGVGGLKRTTAEAIETIKSGRVIFHLSLYHDELKKLNRNIIDLGDLYWTGEEDTVVYNRLAETILSEARNGPGVVVVEDGHPTIYDDVSWDIYRQAKQSGLSVKIEPAISCIDAMAAFCDFEIRSCGLQFLEASSIVECRQEINPHMDALLMQVGWFGTYLLHDIEINKPERFIPLKDYLLKFYPSSHSVTIMSAPDSDDEEPVLVTSAIAAIPEYHKKINSTSNIFIPAVDKEYFTVKDTSFTKKAEDRDSLESVAVIRK